MFRPLGIYSKRRARCVVGCEGGGVSSAWPSHSPAIPYLRMTSRSGTRTRAQTLLLPNSRLLFHTPSHSLAHLTVARCVHTGEEEHRRKHHTSPASLLGSARSSRRAHPTNAIPARATYTTILERLHQLSPTSGITACSPKVLHPDRHTVATAIAVRSCVREPCRSFRLPSSVAAQTPEHSNPGNCTMCWARLRIRLDNC